MKKIIVSGMINIETTVNIKNFPVEYYPVDYNFFGIDITISGVGINVSKALKTLGIATDVHVIDDVNDEYNKDFMEKANILFLSNENILNREDEFLKDMCGKIMKLQLIHPKLFVR